MNFKTSYSKDGNNFARTDVEILCFFAHCKRVSLDQPNLGTSLINKLANFSCFDFIFIYKLRLYEVTRLAIEVQVRDNNVEAAIRVLKKKLLREGIFKELKLRKNYEKPSERKLREKAESIKRFKKLMRKKKFD
jgi:small subunit ribosomal protein S21|tara:strand:+ start:10 stop:411 length:402 start_codon:yes stop_codon:yes gene_type:complete